MSLDTTIHGSPDSIHRLADWLAGVRQSVEDLDVEMVAMLQDLGSAWTGQAATAFYDAAQSMRRSQEPVWSYLGDAVEVFRAYANRLSRGRDYFAEIREEAEAIGLKVVGNVIKHPTTYLTYCPNPDAPYTPPPDAPKYFLSPSRGHAPDPSISPDVNEWNRYRYELNAFNDASRKVGAWEAELDQWLAEHLAPLVGRIEELSSVAEAFARLRAGTEVLVDTALETADARVTVQLEDWRKVRSNLSDAAAEARASARSGNPARRAAYEAFDFAENAARISSLEAAAGKAAHYGKIIPVVGTLVDLSVAGYDIYNGESESSVLAGLGGGIAGGAAGGAIGGGIAAGFGLSGPVGWIVGGAVVLGFAGSEGAKWLWEATVSLDTRESIDYWLEENVFWDPTTGTLSTS